MKNLKRMNESVEFKNDLRQYLLWITDAGFILDFPFDDDAEFLFIRIWKPTDISKTEYNYEDSVNFIWSEISSDLSRAFQTISDDYDIEVSYIYTISSSLVSNGYERTFHDKEQFFNGLNLKSIKSFAISLKVN